MNEKKLKLIMLDLMAGVPHRTIAKIRKTSINTVAKIRALMVKRGDLKKAKRGRPKIELPA